MRFEQTPEGSLRRAERFLGLISASSAIAAGIVAVAAVMQIALSFYFCSQEVGRDLDHGTSANAQLDLDLTPVVVCETTAGAMEFPLAGAVVALGTAIVLLVAIAAFQGFYRAWR